MEDNIRKIKIIDKRAQTKLEDLRSRYDIFIDNFKFHFNIQSEECNMKLSQLILDPTLGQVEKQIQATFNSI